MSREILFKGQIKNTKRWIEGYYAELGKGDGKECYIIQNNSIVGVFEKEENNKTFSDYQVYPETVCQYTGLNDSTKWEELSEEEKRNFLSKWNQEKGRYCIKEDWNGRKIFEGDIVNCKEKRGAAFLHCRVVWNDVWARFDIIAMGCSFPMCLDECDGDISINGSDYEVIGNIYDNLELLNQRKE